MNNDNKLNGGNTVGKNPEKKRRRKEEKKGKSNRYRAS